MRNLSTAQTHMDLSQQQMLNSKITLTLSFLVYELIKLSISKHFSFLIPTNTFKRLHHSFKV